MLLGIINNNGLSIFTLTYIDIDIDIDIALLTLLRITYQ